MPYRTYPSVRYRYGCRTELTEVSGTGNTGGMTRYVPYRTQPSLCATRWIIKWKKNVEKKCSLPWTWKKTNNLHFLGWFFSCESDSELPILVRSQKGISFVQIETSFLLCATDAEMVPGPFFYLLVGFFSSSVRFWDRKFKPTSTTTAMSGAAPSALRSALNSSIQACADWL